MHASFFKKDLNDPQKRAHKRIASINIRLLLSNVIIQLVKDQKTAIK